MGCVVWAPVARLAEAADELLGHEFGVAGGAHAIVPCSVDARPHEEDEVEEPREFR